MSWPEESPGKKRAMQPGVLFRHMATLPWICTKAISCPMLMPVPKEKELLALVKHTTAQGLSALRQHVEMQDWLSGSAVQLVKCDSFAGALL